MRPIQLALVAATVLLAAGTAQASPLNALRGAQIAADGIEVTQNVQEYCFYLDGWRGPGFYRCGFRNRRGLGWHGRADSREVRRDREHSRRDSRFHSRWESRRGIR